MGQGRHHRSFLRWLLLIVSAIQGITPDARDIASPLAMRLLCLPSWGPCDFADEEDSPHAICDAAHQARTWEVRRPEGATRPVQFPSPRPFEGRLSRHIGPRRGGIGEMSPDQDLAVRLCRLVC